MKIVYQNKQGVVCVVHPTDEALESMSIQDIAAKDVPKGIPYALVEDSEIPEDRTFRDAWTIDDSLLIDGVGK